MKNVFIIFLFLICLGACQIPGAFVQTHQQAFPNSKVQDAQAIREKLLNKQPLQHPVQIDLNPYLLKSDVSENVESVNDLFSVLEDTLFKTLQVTGDREPIFTQLIPLSVEAQTLELQIPISNIELRYEILLKGGNITNGSNLTLNGVKIPWDIKHNGEYKVTKLLLSHSNALKVQIQGESGSHAELSITPYEGAGIGLRRQTLSSDSRAITPEVKGILKRLQEKSGDIKISDSGGYTPISAFQMNDSDVVAFESNAIIVRFRDGHTPDLSFLTHYDGELVDQIDEFYKLKVNLEHAPIERLPELLEFYNRGLPENIERISFSSLQSMQIFTIILDVVHRNGNQISSIELNLYNPNLPAYYPSDWDYSHHDIGIPASRSGAGSEMKSWWLSETHVNEAWDHSIGTGVTIAWIDRGFKPNHPELEGRLETNKDNPDITDLNMILGYENSENSLYHGHYALMAGFAGRDNSYNGRELKTVGVAPNVKVIPYSALLSWQFAASIQAATRHNVDVIGFNQSWPLVDFGSFLQAGSELLIGTFVGHFGEGPAHIHVQVPRALALNIPVVFAAHNYYRPISDFTPINKNNEWPIIVVGAVQPIDPTATPYSTPTPATSTSPSPTPRPTATPRPPLLLHANHRMYIKEGNYGHGTNYGSNMIWAPGSHIILANSGEKNTVLGDVQDIGGTSFAAPQVAAVVALIKSRNPQLTPKQIKDTLLDNSVSIHSVKGHPKMASAGLGTVRMLDALEALKKTGSTPAIQTWTGVIRGTGTARWIELNRLLDGTASLQEKVMTIPRQTVAKEIWDNNMKDGSFVVLQGWSNVKAGEFTFGSGEIEVRNVNKLCDLNTCPSTTPASHKPSLQSIIVPAGSAASIDVKIELKGDNLWLDTNFTNLREGELLFKEVDPTTGADIVPSSAPIQYVLNDLTRLTNAKNDGKGLIVNLPANTLMSGKFYKLAFKGLTGQSSFIGATSVATQGFALTAEGTNLPFSLLSAPGVAESPDSYAFEQIKLHGAPGWIQPNVRIPVEPNQFVGIRFNQPINDLKVQVGPIEVPVVSLLKDFAAIGIPEELPAGIHDVILRSTNGVITLEQAVEKVAVVYPPRPEHTPPPTANPGEYSTIYLGNVEGNDEARAYLNDQLVATAHAGDNLYVNIGSSSEDFPLSQEHRNTIRFELENRGGGYTYRFGICGSHEGTCVFGDENGVAGSFNVRNADGEEDTRTGVVYRESIQLYRFAKPMGLSDQPFWYKVFNLPSGSEIRLDNGGIWEQTFVGGAGEKSGAIPMSGDVKQAEENPGHFMLDNCTYFSDTWVNYGVSGHWQGPDAAPASYGIELYRGIHRIFRQVIGQATYPQSVDRSLSLGQQILNWKTSAYANFYPPNGFWHGSICY